MNRGRLLQGLIAVVALHSLLLGGAMLADPHRTLNLAGWDYDGDRFFPAQCGIFLVILGLGYVVAVRHRAYAWGLVASKVIAVLFLAGELLRGSGPPMLLAAAGVDASMAAAVTSLLVLTKAGPRS